MAGLRENVTYRSLLTFFNYIIGFIIFPYKTRVLGPENFGLVSYAMNTVDYFLLFATMGILLIGTRETASSLSDRTLLSRRFSSVFGMNLIFTLGTLIVFAAAVIAVPQFREIKGLLWIGGAKILLTAFTLEWFFSGLEKFRFLALQSIIVRLLYVAAVFIFVRSPEDYMLYFILTVGAVLPVAVMNCICSRRYVRLYLKDLLDMKFLRQNLKLGAYIVMTSMYITFNVMFLGMVSSNAEVGYYSAAVKIYVIILSVFSAYTSVMLPRMSSLLTEERHEHFKRYLQASYKLIFYVGLPIAVTCVLLAEPIVVILSGAEYAPAVTPMRIVMPAMLLVWLSQVISVQGLLPLRKDNIVLAASAAGAVTALALNFLIVGEAGAIGSAIVLIASEAVVLAWYVAALRRRRYFELPGAGMALKYSVMALPYIAVAVGASFICNNILALTASLAADAVIFLLVGRKKILDIVRA